MLNSAYQLNCSQGHENELLKVLSEAIISQRMGLLEFHELIVEEDVTFETYNKMLEVSFDAFSGTFFENGQVSSVLINLLALIMIVVIGVELLIKKAAARREED